MKYVAHNTWKLMKKVPPKSSEARESWCKVCEAILWKINYKMPKWQWSHILSIKGRKPRPAVDENNFSFSQLLCQFRGFCGFWLSGPITRWNFWRIPRLIKFHYFHFICGYLRWETLNKKKKKISLGNSRHVTTLLR